MNILCPEDMKPSNLVSIEVEPMEFPILIGIFMAFRAGYCDRASLIEAIHAWQVTEAKRSLHDEVRA